MKNSRASHAAWCVVAIVIASVLPRGQEDTRTGGLLLRLGGKPGPEAGKLRKVRATPPRSMASTAPGPARRATAPFRGARGDRTGG